jgi:hypothetical protein
VRKWKRRNVGAPGWHKSFSVTLEVDVAKVLGVIALFALAILCAGPAARHASHGIVQTIVKLLLLQAGANESHETGSSAIAKALAAIPRSEAGSFARLPRQTVGG